jgi:hypothetical protein
MDTEGYERLVSAIGPYAEVEPVPRPGEHVRHVTVRPRPDIPYHPTAVVTDIRLAGLAARMTREKFQILRSIASHLPKEPQFILERVDDDGIIVLEDLNVPPTFG